MNAHIRTLHSALAILCATSLPLLAQYRVIVNSL